MGFEEAMRLTEILLACALIQHSVEHLRGCRVEKALFAARIVLSVLLIIGVWTPWVCVALMVLSLLILQRFQGPYNGGSDRMGLLILCCLTLIHLIPHAQWRDYVFGYLALQLVLSYCVSGWVKIINPDWRNGRALDDVFRFSVYPVSEALRGWADWPRLLVVMSWAVMMFEILFPLALLNHVTLAVGLSIAAIFHGANAFLFGLNRFFWIWLAAYPSLIWLQGRVFEAGFF